MISPRIARHSLFICGALGMFTGCNLSSNQEADDPILSQSTIGQSVQARQSGNGGGTCKKPGSDSSFGNQTLLSETWDIFSESRWKGDGDQSVSGGFFHGITSATATAADYVPPAPIVIPSQGAILFSNRVSLTNENGVVDLESGALFLVNADTGGLFNNYVFVSFGYIATSRMVFVELFGSNQGQEFMQIKEMNIPNPANPIFDLNLWVRPNSYQVGFGEEVIDSVHLSHALTSLNLFEVGVNGSRIDQTTITLLGSKVGSGEWPKPHPVKCKHDKKRIGQNCHLRNVHIRMAREKIKYASNPSFGLRCLAKMKEIP